MNPTGKDESIETLRGIAIIMMVAFHVISNALFDDQGIAWSAGRHLVYAFGFLHVPLFAMVSGYVYALRPVQSGGLSDFCRMKLRRLYVPMLAAGTLEMLMRSLVPGVRTTASLGDLWKLPFTGQLHLWFLLALLVLMVFVGCLDSKGCMRTPRRWLVVFLISMAASLWFPKPGFLCLGNAIRFAPCLVLGVGLRRFDHLVPDIRLVASAAIAFLIAFACDLWVELADIELETQLRGLPMLIVELTGNALLIRVRFSNRLLSWLGGYAYTIYLYHAYGMAIGNRGATFLFGDTPAYLLLFYWMGLTGGLLFGVVAQLVIVRKRWSRLLFLGMR